MKNDAILRLFGGLSLLSPFFVSGIPVVPALPTERNDSLALTS